MSNAETTRAEYWKRKLSAYLHDPPSKALDIRSHGERSDAAFRQAGFRDEEIGEYFAHADHTGAAADRFPFPASQASGLQCAFDGIRNTFRHPLSGQMLSFRQPFQSVAVAFEGEQATQPALHPASLAALGNDEEQWRARFFAHWRLWPQNAADRDHRLAFLPADTRIPDHSIWTHMQVVSALAGCVRRDKVWQPAFLRFQLGPVQDFIAAARTTRDLWSGSYLLSWLMASGLKALSARIGPDAVIFPSLRSQPLFDLQWRDELWSKVRIGNGSVWDSMRQRAAQGQPANGTNNPDLDLLTPNLPNVFLAVVPADQADELARIVADAIREEFRRIRNSVWEKIRPSGLLNLLPPTLTPEDALKRFNWQTEQLLNLTWHALSWPETLKDAKSIASQLPRSNDPTEPDLFSRFESVVSAATSRMPPDHRDHRYYVGGEAGPKDTLNNIGMGWALLTAASGWCLDSVRQTRGFDAWQSGGWKSGVAYGKDALTGREEMIFGGSNFADRVAQQCSVEWESLFRHNDEVGAITLVKRIWHRSWLADRWGLRASNGQFPMPNTQTLAACKPFKDDAEADLETYKTDTAEGSASGTYFAVLALDGDSIGQWVSGAKTPRHETQFAAYSDHDGTQAHGSIEYFTRDSNPDGVATLKERFSELLKTRRLVSPSYHLQFSECLGNFALNCARTIVEGFHGRLIYSGGDDVLAMLPAETALRCANALRAAFQGCQVTGANGQILFNSPAPGYLTSEHLKDDSGHPIPFLVPGPAADCSVGIAIAHFKSPLQDVVRAAQAAEKRAKKALGRAAVAVTLMKRSGEVIEWGCKWNSGGIEIYQAILAAMQTGAVSGRFPHRVIQLLEGYISNFGSLAAPLSEAGEAAIAAAVKETSITEIILAEFNHALARQGENKDSDEFRHLQRLAVADSDAPGLLQSWLNSVRKQDQERLIKAKERPAQWEALAAAAKRALLHGPVESQLHALIGLCQTVAFAHRTSSND